MDTTTLTPEERLTALFSRIESLGLRRAPLKRLDISMPQFGMLTLILRQPGIRARELAKTLGVTMPTVSVALHKLEESGWVYRKSDPKDKRSARLFATRKAQVFGQRAQAFRRKRINEFMGALTAGEQGQLFRLLEKAIANLKTDNKSESKPSE